MARAVAASLTQTRLDFTNSILIGTSGGSNINKLQCVQNCLVKPVLQDNYDSATFLLSERHWLPLNKRINFKIATLAYQLLVFCQPTYLSSVLTPHQPQRSLRSVNQNLLSVPHCRSSSFGESFSYCAPKIWNDIPLSVRQPPSPDSFKGTLRRRLTCTFFSFNKKFNI